MAKKRRKLRVESLLARTEAVMREGISAMSEEEFAVYKRESKKIVESINAKAVGCAEATGTHSQKTEAAHA